jgi:hypothetical protein
MLYKIIGADGKEYGPISAEQLRQWIAQGRANAQTRILVEGATEWKLLGTLPEFLILFPAQIPPTISSAHPTRKHNSFAIAGMICGALSLLCCFKILTGVLGIIFSLIALSQINREPARYEGRELAIAGIILSVLGILISIALIIFWLTTGVFQFHQFNFNQLGQ